MGEANYKLKRRKTEDRLLLLIVFLFGTLLYAQSVTFDYALDDKLVITHNDFTQEGIGGIPKLFSTGFLVGFYGEQRNLLAGGRYRPLSLVTFAVEWEVFGRRPGLSHLDPRSFSRFPSWPPQSFSPIPFIPKWWPTSRAAMRF
jgi:hypothetical protein